MEAKFFTFVVLATLAQSSLAWGTENSCAGSTGKLEAQIDTISYGNATALMGLYRVNELVYRYIYDIYEETYGTETGTGDNSSADSQQIRRYETKTENTSLAAYMEEALSAAMIGITPILTVVRDFRPELDIAAGRARAQALLQGIIEDFFYSIELTKSTNYSESRTQINVYENKAILGAHTLIDSFFTGLLNGTNYPAETQAVLACVRQSITSKIVGAFRVIFWAINRLRTQISTGTPSGRADCLSAIIAAEYESSDLLQAEVTEKYAAIYILRIADYLNETGTIVGLFALQSSEFMTLNIACIFDAIRSSKTARATIFAAEADISGSFDFFEFFSQHLL